MNAKKGGGDTVIQEIKIKSPAGQIFEALTAPEAVVTWWGVEGKFQVTRMESDLRPGGKWRMHVTGADGTVSTVAGEYRRIERPRLLVFTWIREQENAHETLVRWDLEERDGVTTVRLTHSGLISDALRSRNSGWPVILGLLQEHIETLVNPSKCPN